MSERVSRVPKLTSFAISRYRLASLELPDPPGRPVIPMPRVELGKHELRDFSRTIELIARLRAGRTVVLVEHNMGVVGQLADNVIVLQQGKVIAEGPYQTVRADPAVVAAYLGAADA